MKNSQQVAQSPLSEQEVTSYNEDGFVNPKYRLSDSLLGMLQSGLEKLLVENPNVRPEQLTAPHIVGNNTQDIIGRQEFYDAAVSDEILDVVEQVIGPDIILWGSQVFCKPGKGGKEVPWHQDGHYWPIRPLATVTMWIALDDVGTDNGCLRVVPGSHKKGLLPHVDKKREGLVFNDQLDDSVIDESKVVDVILRPGAFSLHDVNVFHGSRANQSGRRRGAFAIRYMPSTSHFDRHQPQVQLDFTKRPIWLVRGVDRCGKNDFQVGH